MSGADGDASGHAKYHLKFDAYVPLTSERDMRAYSTAMIGSRPHSQQPSSSKTATIEKPSKPPTTPSAPRTDTHGNHKQRAPPTLVSPTRGRFVQLKSPAETATSDFAYGIIHLYRDVSGPSDAVITKIGKRPATPEEENVLAILAVPSYMTANDFMGFVGEKQRNQVSHFRMIRTEAANRYMVLLKFRTNEAAKRFHKEFNGKSFNSMEPETCHVVFVQSVTFQASSTTHLDTVFPFIDDPFLIPVTSSPTDPTRPAPPPTPSLRELPTCPVCLERMDASVTGLLTILCQHTFHCQCLTKWGDGSCPVCRYSQKKDASDQTRESHLCKTCGATEDLWICLICGHIGCGRYNGAHAFDHYLSTNHLYALELETQRVWDYGGDGYVHRLIQTKSDGKLVEFPPVASTGTYYHPADHPVGDELSSEKLDVMGMEYTYLLTSQLDSQRLYFEEQVASAADKAAKAAKAVEQSNAQLSLLEKRLEDYAHQLRKLSSEKDRMAQALAESEKSKERLEAKCAKIGDTTRTLQKELKEEKVLTEGLMLKVKALSGENGLLETERNELQEQNRDLMFMLENMRRDDIKGGDVGITERPTPKASRRGRK